MTRGEWPRPVVVGIIDDGIAFAHDRFRCGDKSRVEFVWLQDGVYPGPNTNVDYGREILKKEIDDLLETCRNGGAVDEDEIYRRTGLIDFRRPGHKAATWRIAHGTHVMDLACGFGPGKQPSDRPIVCVQLPARTTANTSGGTLTPYAVDALWYIRDRADEIGRNMGKHPLPVVINFSYGLIGGPHDGTSELEIMIDALIKERQDLHRVPLEVVLPAGNSHLTRCHAEVSFRSTRPPRNRKALSWRVLPDDKTPSFLDIWMPRRGKAGRKARLVVTVTPPAGQASLELDDTKTSIVRWRPNGETLCWLNFNEFPPPTGRGRFRIILRPTAPIDGPRPLAPAGTWTITLENQRLSRDELVHAWVQRDDSLYGYPRRGRQSYFTDPSYQRFDHMGREEENDNAKSIVKRAGLINAIATGGKPIVVGGFVRKDDGPANYSAGGPTMVATRLGPTAMSPSEDSIVQRGILAAGSRSGSVVAMGGTSVATPQVTRWVADQLAVGNAAGRAAVETRAQQSETPNRPAMPPKVRGGAGRIPFDPIIPLPRAEKREKKE